MTVLVPESMNERSGLDAVTVKLYSLLGWSLLRELSMKRTGLSYSSSEMIGVSVASSTIVKLNR